MTDEERLDLYLDENPGDIAARRILADLLEEQGARKRACFQRWLADNHCWPDGDLSFFGLTGWHWWSSVTSAHQGRSHAVVPRTAQDHMPGGLWLFNTRSEAEAILARALESAKLFSPDFEEYRE